MNLAGIPRQVPYLNLSDITIQIPNAASDVLELPPGPGRPPAHIDANRRWLVGRGPSHVIVWPTADAVSKVRVEIQIWCAVEAVWGPARSCPAAPAAAVATRTPLPPPAPPCRLPNLSVSWRLTCQSRWIGRACWCASAYSCASTRPGMHQHLSTASARRQRHAHLICAVHCTLTVVPIVIATNNAKGEKKKRNIILPRYHEFMVSSHLISEHFPGNPRCIGKSQESRTSNTVSTSWKLNRRILPARAVASWIMT